MCSLHCLQSNTDRAELKPRDAFFRIKQEKYNMNLISAANMFSFQAVSRGGLGGGRDRKAVSRFHEDKLDNGSYMWYN